MSTKINFNKFFQLPQNSQGQSPQLRNLLQQQSAIQQQQQQQQQIHMTQVSYLVLF